MMYIWYSSKVTLETLKVYSHVSCSLVTNTHCSQRQVLKCGNHNHSILSLMMDSFMKECYFTLKHIHNNPYTVNNLLSFTFMFS